MTMSSFAAIIRGSAKLQAASITSRNLQLALQRWQLYSGSRTFSAKTGDDDGKDEKATTPDRGSWRSWVEEQLSGIDQAALSEQQQLTARQLQQQQKAEALVGDSPDVQRAAAADAREEVAGYGDEEQVAATPGLGSPLEAPAGGEDDAMPADAPAVLDHPVSELSAAEPAEASPQTLEPEPKVETPALSRLSEAADLSVDERIDVFLEAIRTRSWEQTSRQPVNMADGAVTELKLPASGYSEIGSVSSGRLQGQVLNPTRTFYPGQTYEPEDLVPSETNNLVRAPRQKPQPISKTHSNKKVLAAADFRNLEFLNEFVTEGGQIVPRSKTKLQAKVHRHLARQIKTARVMALLPHSGRLKDFQNGPPDFADDDFHPDGTIDDNKPGFRRMMQESEF